ncbi:nicotinate-nucleotide--dimethylbenzimidazole phosphoribosyltransferase, partial [Actinocatenispora thailandica]
PPAEAVPAPMDAAEPVDVGPAEPDDDIIGIRPPDRIAINAAEARLTALASGGAGLGALTEPVAWALGAGDLAGEWESIRVLLVGADHDGGARAGDPPAASAIERVQAGTAPLARLADRLGATVVVADLAEAGGAAAVEPMETADVLTAEQVDAAFELGRSLAERAADEGVQLLVPAACGAGVQAVSAAVLAAATGNEPASLIGRVVGEAGRVDDAAWIDRCVAARDALHRVRLRSRDSRSLLAMLGGPDLAALTGLIIGAAVRHLPVLVDNPATATAMVLARDIAPSSPWWCLIPDHGRAPAVRTVADLLGFDTVLDLGLGLGDGCTALTAVGVLQPALALAASLRGSDAGEPVHA